MTLAPIGFLGGTFDPVHYAHLRLAEEAIFYCGVEQVFMLPSGTPPLREPPVASAEHRLRMLRIAIADNPRLKVDEREVRRTDVCYTVDTLAQVRAELGAERPVCMILGFDQLVKLPRWDRWRQLFDLAHFAVGTRPGFALEQSSAPAELQAELDRRLAARPEELRSQPAGRIFRFDMTALDISASRVRRDLAAGLNVRYLLPEAVLDYIRQNNLYSGGR